MKYLRLLVPIILLSTSLFGQQLTRNVISAGGDQLRNAASNIQLSWTLGEISSEVLTNQTSLQLGFQQGDLDVVVNVVRNLSSNTQWKIYPNPADYRLQIQNSHLGTWRYFLRDGLGRTLLTGNSDEPSKQVELPMITDGIYWLSIQQNTGQVVTKQLFIQQN